VTDARPAPRGLGRGELFAALAASAYGSAYVATAFALRSFEPLVAAVYRSFFAAMALGVILVLTMRRRGVSPLARLARPNLLVTAHLAILGTLGGAVFLVAMNNAVAGVGATIASFVAGLYAVLAAVLAPFVLRERLRPRAVVGFGVALVGTALLARLEVGASGNAGIAWGLLAAVSFALFLVLARRWGRADRLDPVVIAMVTMSVAVGGLGVIVASTRPAAFAPAQVLPVALAALAWLVLAAAGGQVFTATSVKLIPASRSSAFLLLNPIVATILSVALLGERLSGEQLVGGALVLVGIAAATLGLPHRHGRWVHG
jgi:drug/metabolite transporter (DMT)-like permease